MIKKPLKIPAYIDDWIYYCKVRGLSLYNALTGENIYYENPKKDFKGDYKKCLRWAEMNDEAFAYAWLHDNDYEVEERYYYIVIPCGEGIYRRVFVNSNRNLVISGFTYHSEEEARKISKDSSFKLTEKLIKDSELSWTWQFAKELEL